MRCDGLICFQSDDMSYGVKISLKNIRYMHELCMNALPNETGGILVGYYSDDCAWAKITKIIGPPAGSTHRPRFFLRNSGSLLKMLESLWQKNQYYIGEWHYHPFSSPLPSTTDLQTMHNLSVDKKLHCPEPIMIIIGGAPQKWTQHIVVVTNKGIFPLNAV